MTENRQTIFNTIIDYTTDSGGNLDTPAVPDHRVIKQLAENSFDIEKKRLGEIIQGNEFNVPRYQRLYSWTEEQHRELWGDLEDFIEADLDPDAASDAADVFFGSMYFAEQSDSEIYEIIDGQQRITTTYIVFRVLLEKLDELEDELQNPELESAVNAGIDQLENTLYSQEDVFSDRTPTLSLNKHDQEFFNHLIEGHRARAEYILDPSKETIDGRRSAAIKMSRYLNLLDVPDTVVDKIQESDTDLSGYKPLYDSNRRLLDAYLFYSDKFDELMGEERSVEEQALGLLNLSMYIRRSFFFGQFTIESEDSDFRMRIFQILNDRGIDLTRIDKIRANVVNRFSGHSRAEEYIGKWEEVVATFGTDANDIETFLSIYIAATESEVNSRADASGEIENAFASKQRDHAKIEAKLTSVQDAEEFINRINSFAPYFKHIDEPQVDEHELELSTNYRERCQNILIRLKKLQTTQWYPLVLYTYYQTVNRDYSEEGFYKLLKTIENMNFRRVISDVNPNVLEKLYVRACTAFRNLEDEEGRQPFDKLRPAIVDELESNAQQLFGPSFLDLVVSETGWSNNRSRQLLWKIASEYFDREDTGVSRQLNIDSLQLEHVLPISLTRANSDSTIWPEAFFNLEDSDQRISEMVIEYLELADTDEEELEESARENRDEILEYIKNRFTQDIGNMLLLYNADNAAASDRPLSEKLREYHNTTDFDDIVVNKYFTSDSPEMDTEKLQILLQLESLDDAPDGLIEYFDQFWDMNELATRRVRITKLIIDSLTFQSRAEEFEFDESNYIETQVQEEFEKRIEARSF